MKKLNELLNGIEAEIEHQRYYQQLCRLFEMSYWIEDMSEPNRSCPPQKS